MTNYNHPYNPNQSENYQHFHGHYQQADNHLYHIFQAVDRDRNGAISEDELQEALSNGTSHPFNAETVRILTTIFDQNHTGNIEFHEFASLYKYVTDWKNIFSTYDYDRSGSIDRNELKIALQSFGYNLSEHAYNVLLNKFDHSRSGVIYFDDFIHCCVTLQKITEAFRAKDVHRAGVVHLSFEDFLALAFSLRM